MSTDRTLARRDSPPCPERLVAEVLLNRRRRYVLYYLSERSDPVPVEDLAAQVTAWERATAPDDAPTCAETIRSSIRRTHLPYLEARDLVTYDRRTDRVTARIDDPTVKLFAANHPRTTIAWHKLYLVLTAVSTVILGLAQVGVPLLGDLQPVAVAGLIVALFAAASVAHWVDAYRWRRRNEENPPDFLVSVEDDLPDERRRENADERDEENER